MCKAWIPAFAGMTVLVLLGCLLVAPLGAADGMWIEDSFEGSVSEFWGPSSREHILTGEAGTPDGGGLTAFRQAWLADEQADSLWLTFANVPGMPASIGEGDEFYISYYLKYHEDFDWTRANPDEGGPFHKIIVIQSDFRTDDRMYINNNGEDAVLTVSFQGTAEGAFYSNVNNVDGQRYRIPKGEWHRYEWYVKVSPETENPQGILRGWIDGVLRFDHEGIATIEAGSYVGLSINPTFTYGLRETPDTDRVQRRYWDLFAMGPRRPGSAGGPVAEDPVKGWGRGVNVIKPSDGLTAIEFNFEVESPHPAEIKIFNQAGALVRTINTEVSPSHHIVLWDGQNKGGKPVSSGVYTVKSTVGGEDLDVKKVVVVK